MPDDNDEAPIPTGIPAQPTLVLMQVDGKQSTIRGVFTSLDDLEHHLYHSLSEYDRDKDKIVLTPLTKSNGDSDRMATGKVVVVKDGRRIPTVYQVWDSAARVRAEESLKLFWVVTDDHHEDWFIVAHSAREAAKLHESYEGYDIGDATVEYVVDLPVGTRARPDSEVGWPVDETLIACGAKFIQNRRGKPRVVYVGGRTFSEGTMDSIVEAVRATRSLG